MQTGLNKIKTTHPNKTKTAKPPVLETQTEVTPKHLGLSRNEKKKKEPLPVRLLLLSSNPK